MELELNFRIVFRRIDGGGSVICDPDRKRGLVLNSAATKIFSLLRHRRTLDEIMARCAGDDPEKRRRVESFLAQLRQFGMLVGFEGEAPPSPSVEFPVEMPEITGKHGIGSSMLRTFASGDELETERVPADRLRRGDVVEFVNAAGRNVGHRIVGGVPGRWITMGDNNDKPDPEPYIPGETATRIVAKIRKGKRTPIRGGRAGMAHFHVARMRRAVHFALSRIAEGLQNCCFWRIEPEKRTDFGEVSQFSHRGLPLWGDRKYGLTGEKGPIALWSAELAFSHPATGERMTFAAPPPVIEPWTLFKEELWRQN